MPISMECPSCMNTFTLPDELAGRKSKCPECQFGLFVPRGETTVDPTTALTPPSNTAAPTTADKPALTAASTHRRPAEVAAVTPAPSKRARAVRKNALATTPTVPAAGDNPFDFDAQPTASPRRRRRRGGWGMILLAVFALFALVALLIVGVGGAAAWYFWRPSKPPVVTESTKQEEPSLTEPIQKTDPPETPKKVTPRDEPPKNEPPRNPNAKPIRDPIVEVPGPTGMPTAPPVPKTQPNPPAGKRGRLLLSPIPSQTVKPGDKVLLAVSVVREECKGPVVISARTPNAGISVAPSVTLPEDIDRASLQVTVDPKLAAGTYQLPVVAALNALTDNQVFELKVEKAGAPVVVNPLPADASNLPLQIVNAKVHLEGRAYTPHAGAVEAVALSGDAKWAVSGSADGTVNLWELDKGRVATIFSGPSETNISAVALSPDGKWAASGDTQGAIRLHDLEKKGTKVIQVAHKLPPNSKPKGTRVNALEFSPKSDLLVAADQFGLGSYNVATGQQSIPANVVDSPCFHFAPDGTHVYAVRGKSIAVVDVRRLASLSYLGNDQSKQTDFSATCFACFGPKQELIALVRHDKQVELQRINEKTGQTQKLAAFETAGDGPLRIAVAAKAGYAVTSDQNGLIRGWELDTGKELFAVPGHKGAVHGLAVSADGRRCVSGGADGTFRILDLTNVKDDAPKPAP